MNMRRTREVCTIIPVITTKTISHIADKEVRVVTTELKAPIPITILRDPLALITLAVHYLLEETDCQLPRLPPPDRKLHALSHALLLSQAPPWRCGLRPCLCIPRAGEALRDIQCQSQRCHPDLPAVTPGCQDFTGAPKHTPLKTTRTYYQEERQHLSRPGKLATCVRCRQPRACSQSRTRHTNSM